MNSRINKCVNNILYLAWICLRFLYWNEIAHENTRPVWIFIYLSIFWPIFNALLVRELVLIIPWHANPHRCDVSPKYHFTEIVCVCTIVDISSFPLSRYYCIREAAKIPLITIISAFCRKIKQFSAMQKKETKKKTWRETPPLLNFLLPPDFSAADSLIFTGN